MSFLSDLSQGLRGAAGVLSADVQKQTFAQDERREMLRQQQAQFIINQVSKQIENGAIPAERIPRVMEGLKQRGINAPIELFGPSIETQQRQAAIRKQQILEKAFNDGGETGYMNALRTVDPTAFVKLQAETRRERYISIGAGGVKDTTTGEIIPPARQPGEGTKEGAVKKFGTGGKTFEDRAYDPTGKLYPGVEHKNGWAILGRGEAGPLVVNEPPPTTFRETEEVNGVPHHVLYAINRDGSLTRRVLGVARGAVPGKRSLLDEVLPPAGKGTASKKGTVENPHTPQNRQEALAVPKGEQYIDPGDSRIYTRK